MEDVMTGSMPRCSFIATSVCPRVKQEGVQRTRTVNATEPTENVIFLILLLTALFCIVFIMLGLK